MIGKMTLILFAEDANYNKNAPNIPGILSTKFTVHKNFLTTSLYKKSARTTNKDSQEKSKWAN
jgi:hypothetical protein